MATMAIQQGINAEWEVANQECDKLISSVFGKNILDNPAFSAWVSRNTAARDAFISRTENGLNLSDRIWKSVQQLREEMEVAMTVAIGEGDSASSISRKVREYLNDPDLMFRRFRYKKGEKDIIDPETGKIIGKEPIYGLKWKKRIRTADGRYKFIDYDKDSYKTGAGVYKSSAKNAMRVARTETNIAYRRADNARWQQMDFVLGQRVQLSKNHPEKDICDKLQGDYPKDFIFDGWHPQCFCFATPILMDSSEMAKMTQAFLKGETYEPKGRQITEYPAAFKDWIRSKAESIAKARKNGTEPYFIRNNALAIDKILNPPTKKLTPLEIARQRHAARTSEQEEAIRLAWKERKRRNRSAILLNEIIESATKDYIAYLEVSKLDNSITEKEIISKIGGGDLTKGSCSSLALAYAGNRCGFDVVDYRGGKSQGFFSLRSNIEKITEMVNGIQTEDTNDYIVADRLMAEMEQGKEYYFVCASHAAIVRKVASGYEYMELQSSTKNGWALLDKDVLKWRFGAKRSHTHYGVKHKMSGYLIEISQFSANREFQKILGYINTNAAKQKKGSKGGLK